ncbi:MAG: DUF6484 domain-containing protein [Steroidobacteraceae bacterium]
MSDSDTDEAQLETADDATIFPATASLQRARAQLSSLPIAGVRIGILAGLRGEFGAPLVIYPGQPGDAAVEARAALDLHAAHVGCSVVLVFEEGDSRLPIILACLSRKEGRAFARQSGLAEVEADGERLVVSAENQLVLRCGAASITLTKAGKVLIKGDYVSSHSSGTNRIKGGSVQIN